jgi:hypothetical protein
MGNVSLAWKAYEQNAFDRIQIRLGRAPILSAFECEIFTCVTTDASVYVYVYSVYAIGSVLEQPACVFVDQLYYSTKYCCQSSKNGIPKNKDFLISLKRSDIAVNIYMEGLQS